MILCIFAAHSSIAQSVEQLAVNQLVAGSSPARGATSRNGVKQFRLFFCPKGIVRRHKILRNFQKMFRPAGRVMQSERVCIQRN